ncbi:hypothetical protein HYE82_17785, partial [Streptomyces sp. BR123]|nr:hypothetical protein [Streptomyces sp. BR123]
MNASTTSRRSRHRALGVAALTAAAVTGQLLVMSPLAQAAGDPAARAVTSARDLLEPPPGHDEPPRAEDLRPEDGPPPGADESKPKPKQKQEQKLPHHGVQEYTNDGTFVPPPGVTSVFIQAWGAGGGGGGGGGGGSGTNVGSGGTGGG